MIIDAKKINKFTDLDISICLVWDSGAIGRIYQDLFKASFDTLFKNLPLQVISSYRHLLYEAQKWDDFVERANEIGSAWKLFALCSNFYICYTVKDVVEELLINPAFVLPVYLTFPDSVMSLEKLWQYYYQYSNDIMSKIRKYHIALFRYIAERLSEKGIYVSYENVPKVLKNLVRNKFFLVPNEDMKKLNLDVFKTIYSVVSSKADSVVGSLTVSLPSKYTLVTTDEKLATTVDSIEDLSKILLL